MKPKDRRRIAALEARVAALEGARPTVEVFSLANVPDAEPLDVHAIWEAVTDKYAHGYDDSDGWHGGAYI